MAGIEVRAAAAADIEEELDGLTEILVASVNGGAAISFLQPFGPEDGVRFWRENVATEVAAGRRTLLLAWREGALAGTVQLITAMPPNQPHRAEIAKMIVHPAARRRGVGRALMEAAERTARAAGKTLITLDTRTGDAAEPLYASVGYAIAGIIPGYALDPDRGSLHATTYMYKRLN